MIELVLLGQPRGKESVRGTRDGAHHYLPEKTRDYMGALRYVAEQVMAGRPPLDGPLSLALTLRLPIPTSKSRKWQTDARAGVIRPTRKPDWDNFGKILDALNLVVWIDDAQIVDSTVQKFYSDRPGMWISVRPLVSGGVFG
ncbi:MAG: RusA family crossover junction endodeoxyribonuclease [Parvibaculaceae bacterium]